MLLTPKLRQEYARLFKSCEIDRVRAAEVHAIANRIVRHTTTRYFEVGHATGVPALVVGLVHFIDSGCTFERELLTGKPIEAGDSDALVKLWQESAVQALKARDLHRIERWDVVTILFQIERWTGYGYRNATRPVFSPHLWAGSGHYVRGLLDSDGMFHADGVFDRIGAGTLLRFFSEKEVFTPLTQSQDLEQHYDPEVMSDDVAGLQRALNRFPGIVIAVDGIAGPETSAAYYKLTGSYLAGDPRQPGDEIFMAVRAGTLADEGRDSLSDHDNHKTTRLAGRS